MIIHVLWVNFKCVNIQTFNNDINSSDLKAKGIFSFQPFFCLRTWKSFSQTWHKVSLGVRGFKSVSTFKGKLPFKKNNLYIGCL